MVNILKNLAIQVENLSKEYIIGGAEQRHDSFREMLTGALTSPFKKMRKLGGNVGEEEVFWALKDIDFEVQQGEVLGIIGRNGAGKSTLLKVLSRITSPTTGRVVTRGRVASLLEVGTGFHPELTGRENIYLNGAIMGMSRVEIATGFEEIVEFAEIDKFLDTPVKRYSSGMYVRLAFAVAAHLRSDILLVDEVLAVGDFEFQKKCLGKMGEIGESGKTVIFVSHNMGAVSSLCTKAIFLKNGQLDYYGDVTTAVKKYFQSPVVGDTGIDKRHFIGNLRDKVFFKEISINEEILGGQMTISPDKKLIIRVGGESTDFFSAFDIYVSIFRDGVQLVTLQDSELGEDLHVGRFNSTFELPAKFLRPGTYSISVGGSKSGWLLWVWGRDLGEFTILEKWLPAYEQRSKGVVNFSQPGTREQIGLLVDKPVTNNNSA